MSPSLSRKEGVYKSFVGEMLESSSSKGREWVSDITYEILMYLQELETVRPYDLVLANFCKDPKTAYVYIQRLVKKGVLQKSGWGTYRVIREAIKKLLKLPVRKVSTGKKEKKEKKEKVVRKPEGTRGLVCGVVGGGLGGVVGGGSLCVGGGGVGVVGSGVLGCFGGVGGFGYVGVFFDNVRWVGFGGGFHQLGRGGLFTYGQLPDGVRYFEVTHVVGGDVLDGVVVIYSNVEDFNRFKKPSVRVEWRPPSGYVRKNGVANTVHYAKHELVKAFKSLAIVLKNVMTPRELGKLFNWLTWAWRAPLTYS